MGEILDMLAAGRYWPALAAGLMLMTHAIRKGGADRMLCVLAARIPGDDARQVSHLRAWIPIVLALAAWIVAIALPLDVGMRDAAHTLLLATIAAMAGYDLVMASGTLAKAATGTRKDPPASVGRADEVAGHQNGSARTGEPSAHRLSTDASEWRALLGGTVAAISLALVLIAAAVVAAGCASPQSRPLASYAMPASPGSSDDAAETRADCRRLRDRGVMAGAGGAAAGVLATGLGSLALATDHDRAELALNVSAAVTAALGAGLALLATSYSAALDNHCTPWPRREVL